MSFRLVTVEEIIAVMVHHFNLNNHQKVPIQHEEGTFFACTFLLECPYLYQPSRNKRAISTPYNFR